MKKRKRSRKMLREWGTVRPIVSCLLCDFIRKCILRVTFRENLEATEMSVSYQESLIIAYLGGMPNNPIDQSIIWV